MRDLLRGERIRLTPMTEADLPALARWDLDGVSMRMLDSGPTAPRNEAQLGEWMRASQAKKDEFLFALRPIVGEEILGYVQLDGVLWSLRVTSFSILIGDPANRGRGYGTDALQLLLGYAFHEMNLHRVELQVFAYNTGAIRAYERAGFRYEGAHREFLERDGVRYDMLLYGILRPEWEALRRERSAQPSGAESSGA